MEGIKVFVGHSFASDDKEVVGKFLEHFRTLSRVYPGFTWDHAEDADLKTLSDKVLSKIEGKNVFIGICTGRELAIERTKLSRSLLAASTLKASSGDFNWKTSDWLIQEIGLAIGRGMKLIIFLEEGVREPGGLYGDLEYIAFSRSHPNDSFDKLLQMLSSISPTEHVSLQAGSKLTATEKEVGTDASIQMLEPKPTWSEDDYDNAAFHAIWKDDEKALENINETYEASPLAKGQALAHWRANQEHIRLVLAKNPNFDRLKALAEENPESSKILYYLARAYAEYEDHAQAAKAFREAAKYSKGEEEALRDLGEAVTQHAYGGEKQLAVDLLDDLKKKAGNSPKLCGVILPYIKTFAEIEKDNDFLVAIMERDVELRPHDFRARFDLAYNHSQIKNEDMALQHYVKIPTESRSGVAWNNLGVSLKQFEMPVRSVRAFRKSETGLHPVWLTPA